MRCQTYNRPEEILIALKFRCLPTGQTRQKNSLKECVFVYSALDHFFGDFAHWVIRINKKIMSFFSKDLRAKFYVAVCGLSKSNIFVRIFRVRG